MLTRYNKCLDLRFPKSQQHPKDFPGGHPPQYYPGLARLNFGVQMGSGAFNAVWPLTKQFLRKQDSFLPTRFHPK